MPSPLDVGEDEPLKAEGFMPDTAIDAWLDSLPKPKGRDLVPRKSGTNKGGNNGS